MSERGPLDFDGDEDDAPEPPRSRARGPWPGDPDFAGDEPVPLDAPAPKRRPAPGSQRFGIAGIVIVVLGLGYVLINGVNTDGPGSTGLAVGEPAPPFAAPLAASRLEGDVNVARRDDSGEAGAVAACTVRRPDVVTACPLWQGKPLVLTFFADRNQGCVEQLDTIERLRGRHPGVNFAGMSIRGDRGKVRGFVERRGWRFPVGYDSDGVLANLYGVAVCPHVAFVARGGRVAGTAIGELDGTELERRITLLEQGRRLPE